MAIYGCSEDALVYILIIDMPTGQDVMNWRGGFDTFAYDTRIWGLVP
jgi:hypothetical protein